MKKILAVAAIFLGSMIQTRACDICGCGVSNYNPYLFPHLSKAYVGLSYYYRQYHTTAADGSINKEFYNSLLLTGQFTIGKRLQLVGMVPYQFNHLSAINGTKHLNGVGDITLVANYQVWERKSKGQRHTLTGGLGVKLPTGKYTPVTITEKEQQNFQIGTGSVDYLLNAAYRFSVKNWVFAGTSNYKYNTANSDDFRYGDVWTNGVTAIYRNDFENISLLPYLSFTGEHYMKDANKHILQDHSGGNVFLAGAGLDVNTRKIAVGMNCQVPVSQNISKGEILAKPRISAHFSFIF